MGRGADRVDTSRPVGVHCEAETVLLCARLIVEAVRRIRVDIRESGQRGREMIYRTLLMLWLSALPVRAQIAVSANDTTEILVMASAS